MWCLRGQKAGWPDWRGERRQDSETPFPFRSIESQRWTTRFGSPTPDGRREGGPHRSRGGATGRGKDRSEKELGGLKERHHFPALVV